MVANKHKCDQFDCLTCEQLAIWGVIRKLSTSLLTNLFSSIQLVNPSLTLTSFWRFCRTEFLWKGYQTLFFPTQTQKEKSGLATQDYVGIKHIALLHTRSCDQFCTHFKINWIPLAQVCDAALTWSSYAHLLGETAHQIWGKLCKLFTRHSKSKQTFMFFHFFHKRKIAITHKRINWSG